MVHHNGKRVSETGKLAREGVALNVFCVRLDYLRSPYRPYYRISSRRYIYIYIYIYIVCYWSLRWVQATVRHIAHANRPIASLLNIHKTLEVPPLSISAYMCVLSPTLRTSFM